MADRYFEIDGNGKPTAINKVAAQKVPGMPDDDALCDLKVTANPLPKVEDDGKGGKTQVNVPAYLFECAESNECKKKNKKAEDKKAELEAEIKKLDDIVDDKKASAAAHKEAQTKKLPLQKQVAAFQRPCALKALVDTGGDDDLKGGKHFTPAQLVEQKIKYIVCTCTELKIPDPPKTSK